MVTNELGKKLSICIVRSVKTLQLGDMVNYTRKQVDEIVNSACETQKQIDNKVFINMLKDLIKNLENR